MDKLKNKNYDFVIIGAGIIGLAIAKTLIQKGKNFQILILEKESEVAYHSSGRNSGVLHAGFYYTADTLKAKFSVDGNRSLVKYCEENRLPIAKIGKLVIANDESELAGLDELAKRGKTNGCNVSIISAEEAAEIEPNINTYQKALWSPDTATVDPKAICLCLKAELKSLNVEFLFNEEYQSYSNGLLTTNKNKLKCNHLINAAGLYADKIARAVGFSKNYSIVPFKGLYLKYTKNKTDIRTNIYPVPNLKHTFLGVHFTKTFDGTIKIGPTAIPAFWRENYSFKENFKLNEMIAILGLESKLFLSNSFGFRDLAFEEMKKYSKNYLVSLSKKMVKSIDPSGFTEFTKPGIRAQLVNLKTLELINDFVIEGDENSTHILNVISPGFTCAFPFAEYVVRNHVLLGENTVQKNSTPPHVN